MIFTIEALCLNRSPSTLQLFLLFVVVDDGIDVVGADASSSDAHSAGDENRLRIRAGEALVELVASLDDGVAILSHLRLGIFLEPIQTSFDFVLRTKASRGTKVK